MEDEKLLNILLSLSDKCFAAAERARKDLGLTASEYRGLACLLPEEKISCRDFSSRIKLSVSRSSRIIEGLFRKGLLERTECISDRRCKNIRLTRKGIQARMKVRAHIESCEERLLADMSEERLSRLKSDLKELVAKL